MNPIDFSKTKTVHFIGIGGIGTSAIARMFLGQGKKVSGTDMAESEVATALRELGADVKVEPFSRSRLRPASGGQARFNLEGVDLVMYTIAISPDHPELVEAKKRGIPILSYPEALGIISRDKYTIAVTGTHGKTTTTAMIAKILMDAGLDPTVIIGSFLNSHPTPVEIRFAQPCANLISTTPAGRTNFIGGKGKYLVVEGCEYRRSFLNLSPKVLVITNIDNDHLDYYKDLDDIESAFGELAAKVQSGAVVCDFADRRAKRAAAAAKDKVIDFEKYLTEVSKLLVPGTHNKKNAAAALAVADFLGVKLEVAKKSLAEFRGTWRRFEYRGKTKNGALVYDDYGHHPTEIEATLNGARELFPAKKIIVVFQPHLYSRTKQHLDGFGAVLAKASSTILLPIYSAREPDPGDINSGMVVEAIKRQGGDAHLVGTFKEAAALAKKLSGAGDLILTLGAGETNKVADMLVGISA